MADKKQLLELLERYGGDLMSFALSLLKSRPDAEDACQEMAVQMLKHWDGLDQAKNLKSWAFTILYRKCLDQLKKRRRFLNFFNRVAEVNSSREEDRSDSLVQDILPETILNRLKPKEKACLLLWAREGYNSEEIAGILGCAPGTVRVHLFQARKKIKKLMEKRNERKDKLSAD
jgi:RNA polymerase sigma-70 factor (ECF subfamily)